MRIEIEIPEHHYNNIMALDSVSLGRVPYKGIIMYTINAIRHGKVLEQEPIKPTIESRPVIRANWLSGDCKGAHCSNCEEYTPFVYGAYNFCPNCGADMREVEE